MGRDLTEAEKKIEAKVDDKIMKGVFLYDYPSNLVNTGPFFMDKYEVSNRDYAKFVRATNRAQPENWRSLDPPLNAENLPVTFVNYQDASDFCAWRGGRLPTEEEWEYGARGENAGKPGARMFFYPWGDAWETRRANTLESKLGYPQIVTANPASASPFGLLNMAGNVYEWTASDFNHYQGSTEKTPREAGYEGIYQVVRGG